MSRNLQRVLPRVDATQYVIDLGDCIDDVISLSEDQDMSGRALACETLLRLKVVRDGLQTALASVEGAVQS